MISRLNDADHLPLIKFREGVIQGGARASVAYPCPQIASENPADFEAWPAFGFEAANPPDYFLLSRCSTAHIP